MRKNFGLAVHNMYGEDHAARAAVRAWYENPDSIGALVVTRAGSTGLNFPACTHVLDLGEEFEFSVGPITFQRVMQRVDVTTGTWKQAAGRCGRHKAGTASLLGTGAAPERHENQDFMGCHKALITTQW